MGDLNDLRVLARRSRRGRLYMRPPDMLPLAIDGAIRPPRQCVSLEQFEREWAEYHAARRARIGARLPVERSR